MVRLFIAAGPRWSGWMPSDQAGLVTITQVEDIVAPAVDHPHWIRPRNITHGSLTTIAPDRKEHSAAAVSVIGTMLIDNAHRIAINQATT